MRWAPHGVRGLASALLKLPAMSVQQIEEAIARLPSNEFEQLLAWMRERELASERETAYLLDNPAMKARLLEARESISLEEARARLVL